MTQNPDPLAARRPSPARAFATVFFAVFILVFATGALITFFLPETFLSTARVRAATPAQVEAFKSPATLAALAEQLDLNRTLGQRYGDSQPLTTERTVNILSRMLRVRPIPKSDLAEIRVYSLDSAEAAYLANAIAKAGLSSAAYTNQTPGTPGEIIDAAVPSQKPARPNRALNLYLSACVAALLGVFAGGVGARLAVGFGGVQLVKP